MMLKLCVHGYLHQLTSSRKLEREAGRNIELMWPTAATTIQQRSWSRASGSFRCAARLGLWMAV